MTDNAQKYVGPGENLEPLDDVNYILQPAAGYRFGSDAVALAKFASRKIKRGERVFDLCSGCGVVGILTAIYTGAAVRGAEIDDRLCDMSNRSALIDGLDASFVNADIRNIPALIASCGKGFDAVVCNPPYFKAGSKPSSVAPGANSELTVGIKEVCAAAKALLKGGGAFYMVYTSTRLDDAICACRESGLMPKELVMTGSGKTFLLRSAAGGKQGMTVVKER